MRPYSPPPTDLPTERPVVSEVTDGPDGRSFNISFAPWQKLPPHRNASRIVITPIRGSGSFSTSEGVAAALKVGDAIQLDPDVMHSVAAGEDGLDITVYLIAACCGTC